MWRDPTVCFERLCRRGTGARCFRKVEDGSYAGRIPSCPGVIAFGSSLRECENELRSTLEDWILVGLQLKHPLPVIEGIDLNKEPAREPVDAV